MVKQERLDGTDWYRTWSDTGKSLLQVETGAIYGEAIDHISNTYTYVEIDDEGDMEEITDEEAYRIITEDERPEDERGDDEISDEEALNIILGREEENDEGTSESVQEND